MGKQRLPNLPLICLLVGLVLPAHASIIPVLVDNGTIFRSTFRLHDESRSASSINLSAFTVQDNTYGLPLLDTLKSTRDTIGIEEVVIKKERLSPEEQYEQNKREYRKIYSDGDNKNIIEGFWIFPPVIVLNINKIYNHFSSSGKRARRLQQVLEDDFKRDKVNESWYPLTQKFTNLEGQELEDFRRYYQPDLAWWSASEDYDQLDYVFKRLKNYRDSSAYIRSYLTLPTTKIASENAK